MVNIFYYEFVTISTVNVESDVAKVTCKGNRMQYKGSGEYQLGIVGVKRGDNIPIAVFDGSGKLLETKNFTVQ